MANIFAYNNRLWKEKFGFTTPGVHDFTLPSGEYLMMCHGATGGSSWSSYRNRGGVAYGILNLSEQKSMHAFVGGDGGNAGSTGYQIGIGGFNGGGNGGKGYQDSSSYGAGGGGATHIARYNSSYGLFNNFILFINLLIKGSPTHFN